MESAAAAPASEAVQKPPRSAGDEWSESDYLTAKSRFLSGERLHVIASSLGMPKATLYDWSRKGKWKVEKRQIDKQIERASSKQIEKFVEEKRLSFVRENVRISQKASRRVVKMLDPGTVELSIDGKSGKVPLNAMDEALRLQRVMAVAEKAHRIGARTLGLESDNGKHGKGNAAPALAVNVMLVHQSVEQVRKVVAEVKEIPAKS